MIVRVGNVGQVAIRIITIAGRMVQRIGDAEQLTERIVVIPTSFASLVDALNRSSQRIVNRLCVRSVVIIRLGGSPKRVISEG